MIPPFPLGRATDASAAIPDRQATLRSKAAALEAAFLSEMLGLAGFGAAREGLGGGAGEAQFGSFLRDQQAGLMVKKGGIGLAESLFRAMAGDEDGK